MTDRKLDKIIDAVTDWLLIVVFVLLSILAISYIC